MMFSIDWIGEAIIPLVCVLIPIISAVITAIIVGRRKARAKEEIEHKEELRKIEEEQNQKIDDQGNKIAELTTLMGEVTVALGGKKAGMFTQKETGLVEVVGSLATSVSTMRGVMATKDDVKEAEANLTLIINQKGGAA